MQESMRGLGGRISRQLRRICAYRKPDVLYAPVRYVLSGGGKHLRPVLLITSARMYGVAVEDALPMALSIELSHNWALVHDDIMDAADTRRGRPTVHRKWDVNTALLCGDVLMGLAYGQLQRAEPGKLPALMEVLTGMVRLLCEGQALDMAFESRSDVTTPEYLDMIDLKTGALTGAAMEMGAILGGTTPQARAAIRSSGIALGRAFQIMDDLLDLVARDARWGKVIGGDLVEGKKTLLLLEALGRARGEDYDFFNMIVRNRGLNPDRIDEARQRMDALGVLEYARKSVRYYTQRAIAHLSGLSVDTRPLVGIMEDMAARAH